MTNHTQDSDRLLNPAKLADDAVLALSSIERGGKASRELLEEGIKLCDYLIGLLEGSNFLEESKSRSTFRTFRDSDMEALKENNIDIDRVRKVKDWINELMEDPSSHKPEEIRDIQKLLITATMPMWQNRTLEFRKMKLKAGLIVRG